LCSKREDLSSNPSPTKKKKKEKIATNWGHSSRDRRPAFKSKTLFLSAKKKKKKK
jgi:hypothetical protein